MAAPALSSWLFRSVTHRHAAPPRYDDERFMRRYLEYDVESTRRFFSRFDGALDLRGKSVLDVGCGRGAVCLEAARRGATRVVGVELELQEQAVRLAGEDPGLAERIELVETSGWLDELGTEQFDVVLSKDSFEHYARPEEFVFSMTERIRPGGLLAIGFGPLWKAPTGGHIEYMTALPWAHLVFPEEVIMAERRRFRPEEDARTFAEIRGGLNRMTLARFRRIIGSTGLECLYYDTNVSDRRSVKAMKAASRIATLREYLTVSVYGVWRKPPAACA